MLQLLRLAALPSVLPYVVGAVAAVILSLAGALAYCRFVEVPSLELANAELRAETEGFRAAISTQNAEVERLSQSCRAASSAADLAGIRAAKKPTIEEARTADALNRWLMKEAAR